MVSVADVMMIEATMKRLTRMRVGLLILRGTHSTPYDSPVNFTFGSNSFFIDIEYLEFFMPLLDWDADIGPTRFLEDYMYPFLENYAG